MNLFKDYYCSTYRDSDGWYGRMYLRIHRRDDPIAITSFRIRNRDLPPTPHNCTHLCLNVYDIKQDDWDTFAPLIMEYVVNDLKLDNIYLDDMYDGN